MRRGARVVSAEGAPAAVLTPFAESWLAQPVPSASLAPPLGDVRLPPNEKLAPSALPSAQNGWLRYPAASIELPIPEGFEPVLSPNETLRLERKSTHESTEIDLSLGEYFDSAPTQILLDFSRAMAAGLAFSNVVEVGEPYPVATGLGRAMARNFEHDGTIFKGRAVAVPLCGGAGMLTVLQHFGTGNGEPQTEALTKLRALPGSDLCARLAH